MPAALHRRSTAPLWRCAECGRKFATRNQTHTCGLHTLASHLDRSTPQVRRLFDGFVALVSELGPVTILPEKTRIAFATRMSFAAVVLQKRALVGHLVLAERCDVSCFHRIDTISPRNHVHHFRIRDASNYTEELLAQVRRAYAVGEQKHLFGVV